MMVGLVHVQDVCCSGGGCGGVYPGADTPCTAQCAEGSGAFCHRASASYYHAFGLIGTALSKKISVFQSSSLKVVPISPNAW